MAKQTVDYVDPKTGKHRVATVEMPPVSRRRPDAKEGTRLSKSPKAPKPPKGPKLV